MWEEHIKVNAGEKDGHDIEAHQIEGIRWYIVVGKGILDLDEEFIVPLDQFQAILLAGTIIICTGAEDVYGEEVLELSYPM